MKNKLFGIVALVSALILSWVICIVFNAANVLPVIHQADVATYWISKSVATVALLIIGTLLILGKGNVYTSVTTVIATAALQLLPLANRLIAQITPKVETIWVLNVILTVVIILAYIILVFAFKLVGDRYKQTLVTAKPKEIKVVETDSYLDENGDLKGPGQN